MTSMYVLHHDPRFWDEPKHSNRNGSRQQTRKVSLNMRISRLAVGHACASATSLR
jgi:hypothetical protein